MRLSLGVALLTIASGQTLAQQAVAPGNIYSRIPAEVAGFKLTERTSVTSVPSDSVFRFRNDSRTTVTVIIYEVPAEAKVGADSQSWTPRQGEQFLEVMVALRERGRISDFTEPVSSTARITGGGREIVEHAMSIPTRHSNGNVVVEMQFLYLIDGKFVKVRATVPHEEFKASRMGSFARELAQRVAGPGK